WLRRSSFAGSRDKNRFRRSSENWKLWHRLSWGLSNGERRRRVDYAGVATFNGVPGILGYDEARKLYDMHRTAHRIVHPRTSIDRNCFSSGDAMLLSTGCILLCSFFGAGITPAIQFLPGQSVEEKAYKNNTRYTNCVPPAETGRIGARPPAAVSSP